jgi:hypothetical protein
MDFTNLFNQSLPSSKGHSNFLKFASGDNGEGMPDAFFEGTSKRQIVNHTLFYFIDICSRSPSFCRKTECKRGGALLGIVSCMYNFDIRVLRCRVLTWTKRGSTLVLKARTCFFQIVSDCSFTTLRSVNVKSSLSRRWSYRNDAPGKPRSIRSLFNFTSISQMKVQSKYWGGKSPETQFLEVLKERKVRLVKSPKISLILDSGLFRPSSSRR